MPNSENNKRIAKNTILLYFRMFLTMGVSLYTSRIVLNTLGVEDFGIYNLVGGVVMMFSFLNSSMSGATSRFLTYELGRQNQEQLKNVFSASITIHLIIAIIIIILGETIGVYFLNRTLVIPENRMIAANWIFQFSLLSACISIIQTPFNALIIAHERVKVFAIIEILNVSLKLIIVYLLVLSCFDKLIVYGILVLFVYSVIAMIYLIYCNSNFKESNFRIYWGKELLRPMLSFSGWDLFGNMSVMARTQGVNMLLNISFGSIINAASGIAIQVQSAIMGFASNILMAVRPQIIKSYSAEDFKLTVKLINNTSIYTYILLLIISLPLILEMHFVLDLWLKNVPDHTVAFCQLTLTFNFIANMSSVVISGIHASGKIKRPSIINGTLYLSVIPITYLCFKFDGVPELPYAINAIFVFIGLLLNAWTLKIYLPYFSFNYFAFHIIGKCFMITIIAASLSLAVQSILNEGWLRIICVGLTTTLSISLLTYFLAIDKGLRIIIRMKVIKFVTKMS